MINLANGLMTAQAVDGGASLPPVRSDAWAAESRAMGTRNGEHET
jgi:hypothetical protein